MKVMCRMMWEAKMRGKASECSNDDGGGGLVARIECNFGNGCVMNRLSLVRAECCY